MTSDTPLTDAITIHPGRAVTSEYSALECHARELERENSLLRALLKRADDALDGYNLGKYGSPLRSEIADVLANTH